MNADAVVTGMSGSDSTAMDEGERDAFLGTGGTGVVSFPGPSDDPPHSIPVSYGYDSAETTFYFRLAVGPDSDKGDLPGRPVTFVVHGQEDGDWRSVVAKGHLEATTAESVANESLQGLQRVHIPLVDVFGRPPGDVPFEFYRLVPDELTARREGRTPA
jgi:nitroimidazol reductase NimA-like FMN-containing flavoprotein (pyridoxamine 5'-phosphate oxidase superfamily)